MSHPLSKIFSMARLTLSSPISSAIVHPGASKRRKDAKRRKKTQKDAKRREKTREKSRKDTRKDTKEMKRTYIHLGIEKSFSNCILLSRNLTKIVSNPYPNPKANPNPNP